MDAGEAIVAHLARRELRQAPARGGIGLACVGKTVRRVAANECVRSPMDGLDHGLVIATQIERWWGR